jgi:Protein of unknown function (DUF3131)
MLLGSVLTAAIRPAQLMGLRLALLVGMLMGINMLSSAAMAQSEHEALQEKRSNSSEEISSLTVDFSFDPRHRLFAPSVFSDEANDLSYAGSIFSLDAITFPSQRFWFLPTALDFSPSLPEVEAVVVQPRSFAPNPSVVSKPVFKLYPKPSKLPKREPPPPKPDPVLVKVNVPASSSLTNADILAAQVAWQYIKRNWNASTGLVNAVEDYHWTTLWDQGSAILGIHAARQLNLITTNEFKAHMGPLLQTLKTLPLASTGLPNKAYSTRTAQMYTLDNAPDPQGKSGWSVLDTARLLLSLHIVRTHYPEYKAQVNAIVKRWKLSQLEKDGWLQGGVPGGQRIVKVQEGRLGYEQYAAESLKTWNITAHKALSHPPITTVQVDGVRLNIDRRNLKNSGASNHLTNDPYLFWGLELGWTETVKPQVLNLLAVQQQRHQRTGLLTAVNEDSLDRPPYFVYSSVYADGKPWNTKSASGQPADHLKQLSTKAAFAWEALFPKESYTKLLRNSAQSLMDKNRGFFAGRFENQTPSVNTVFNVNTNAAVLESILFKARNRKPLSFP